VPGQENEVYTSTPHTSSRRSAYLSTGSSSRYTSTVITQRLGEATDESQEMSRLGQPAPRPSEMGAFGILMRRATALASLLGTSDTRYRGYKIAKYVM
jgi:hypothetical protein